MVKQLFIINLVEDSQRFYPLLSRFISIDIS